MSEDQNQKINTAIAELLRNPDGGYAEGLTTATIRLLLQQVGPVKRDFYDAILSVLNGKLILRQLTMHSPAHIGSQLRLMLRADLQENVANGELRTMPEASNKLPGWLNALDTFSDLQLLGLVHACVIQINAGLDSDGFVDLTD